MKIRPKIVATISCYVALTNFSARGQEGITPLPIQRTLQASNFTFYVPIALSPDGQWVAFTSNKVRRAPNPEGGRYSRLTASGVPVNFVGSDVWIANTATSEARNLTQGQGTNWDPVWSPKGDYLAFNSDRSGESHLWVWEKSKDRIYELSAARISSGINFEGAEWTPDGKQLVVRVLPDGMDVEDILDTVYGRRSHPASDDTTQAAVKIVESLPAKPEIKTGGQDGDGTSGVFRILLSDLAVIDVRSGAIHRIARKLHTYSFTVSPNGSHVAVMSYERLASLSSQQPLCVLTLVSLRTHDVRVVASKVWWNMRPMSWSPDSRSLVYGTVDPQGQNNVFLVPLDGQESRKLILPRDFGTPGHCPWLWDASGKFVYSITKDAVWRLAVDTGNASKVTTIPNHSFLTLIAASGGSKVWFPGGDLRAVTLVLDEQTLQEGFWKVDLTTGDYTRVWERAVSHDLSRGDATDAFKVSADNSTVAYLAEDAQHPEDVWVTTADFKSPRKVTDTNPELNTYVPGASRLISWRSLDGADLKGALLLPTGYQEGKRYPLLVYVYGGLSLSTMLNKWGGGPGLLNMQILATRGYAVLFPDAPEKVGTPMQDLGKTVLPGVEKAIDLGIADPEHVGIMGQSYGGYSALALVEQSTQFKAAVDFAGLTNLINAYANDGLGGAGDEIGWVEEGWGLMGGSLWQVRDRFIENSPLFYLDRIQTPILIIHGDSDNSVPVREGHIAFQSLRRLGKEVSYAEYKGEGHIPQYWNYANQLDLDNRILNWLDKYLK